MSPTVTDSVTKSLGNLCLFLVLLFAPGNASSRGSSSLPPERHTAFPRGDSSSLSSSSSASLSSAIMTLTNRHRILSNHMTTNTNTTDTIVVPVVFHVLWNGDEQHPMGKIKPARLHHQVEQQLNQRMNPHFLFYIQDIQYHVRHNLQCGKDALTRRQMLQAWRQTPDGTHILHIVTCETQPHQKNTVMTTYPWHVQAALKADGIFISYKTLQHSQAAELAKYVGHWLGLYHTYQGGCTLGDQIPDTPPQLYPRGYCNDTKAYCQDSTREPWQGTIPPPNVMDLWEYQQHDDMDCPVNNVVFTKAQMQRMVNMWHVYRATQLVQELRPSNDQCTRATLVGLGDSIPGTTVGAYFDGRFHTLLKNRCGGNPASPAVFYKVIGTGEQYQASLCNDDLTFHATLSLYQGECYQSATCLATQSRPLSGCSALTWFAETDQVYLLGVNDNLGQVGTFRLDIDRVTIPPNNGCHSAMNINSDHSVISNTFGAMESVTGSGCGRELSSRSVWHSYIGSGRTVTATTCSPMTSFETEIVVLRGECDQTFNCVARSNPQVNSTGDSCATVSFPTIADQPYKILVNSINELEGNYELSLREQTPPGNDFCDNAQRIGRYTTLLQGSTKGATSDDEVNICKNIDMDQPGVWYLITGTGNTLEASTCVGDAPRGTQLALFTGTCAGLTCLDVIGDSSPTQRCSTITWLSSPGIEYRLFVQATGPLNDNLTGDFSLRIRETLPPTNTACESVEYIELNQLVSSDTRAWTVGDSTLFSTCRPDSTPTPGHWFEVRGNGGIFHASTCAIETDFDTQILVLGGTGCNNAICIAYNDDAPGTSGGCSSVQWQTIPGEPYKLFINGYAGGKSMGNYVLLVKETPEVPNDTCVHSLSIDHHLNGPIRGSILGARPHEESILVHSDNCHQNVTSPVAFYSITGQGDDIFATTCFESTTFDTQLTVASGGCDIPVCVTENDDATNATGCSTVRWHGALSTQYTIMVHGFEDEFGDFELDVSMIPTPGPTVEPVPSTSQAPSESPSETITPAPFLHPETSQIVEEKSDDSGDMLIYALVGGGAGLLAAAILFALLVRRRFTVNVKQ